ncbi:MAG: hypothetical protein IT302_04165 [Dehalococcoidia bacterium]|nr:hypothetical protein [Dehalococcoidia bacterium]
MAGKWLVVAAFLGAAVVGFERGGVPGTCADATPAATCGDIAREAAANGIERGRGQLMALWGTTPGGGAETYEGIARALRGSGPGVGPAGPLSTR